MRWTAEDWFSNMMGAPPDTVIRFGEASPGRRKMTVGYSETGPKFLVLVRDSDGSMFVEEAALPGAPAAPFRPA